MDNLYISIVGVAVIVARLYLPLWKHRQLEEDAETMKKALEAAGAKVELK